MIYFYRMMQSKEPMRKYLTKKEEEEALKAFRIFDQDGSGSISIRVPMSSRRSSTRSSRSWGRRCRRRSCR